MLTKKLTIINKLGLHARAAAKLVATAARFHAHIEVHCHDKTADAKSIMAIMMLAASRGSTVEVTADGEDAQAALGAIEMLISDKFGEDQ